MTRNMIKNTLYPNYYKDVIYIYKYIHTQTQGFLQPKYTEITHLHKWSLVSQVSMSGRLTYILIFIHLLMVT